MAISVIANDKMSIDGWTSYYWNKPTWLANGHTMVVFTVSATGSSVTQPAGWTRLTSKTNTGLLITVDYKYVSNAAGEPSSYTWTGGTWYGTTHFMVIGGLTSSVWSSFASWSSTGQVTTLSSSALSLVGGNGYFVFSGAVGQQWFDGNDALTEDQQHSSPNGAGLIQHTLLGNTFTIGPYTVSMTSQNYAASISVGFAHTATAPNNPVVNRFNEDPGYSDWMIRNEVSRMSWVHSDDPWQPQTSAVIEYRVNGSGGAFTIINVSSANQFYDFPANTLAVDTYYEFRVKTTNSAGLTSGYTYHYAWARNRTTAPTITSPANNATVNASHDITWTATNQEAYEYRAVGDSGGSPNTANIILASGIVEESATRNRLVYFPTNGQVLHNQVRVRYNRVWSNWSSVKNTVTFTAPLMPTSFSMQPYPGPTGNHILRVALTNPTPSGGSPTPSYAEVWIRPNNDTSDGVKLATFGHPDAGNNWSFEWHEPQANTIYDFRIKVVGVNTAFVWTAWTDSGTITIPGVLLHVPRDMYNTIKNFKLNDSGAADYKEIESELIGYQGREYPVVEYGSGSRRTIDVKLMFSEGSTDANDLRVLLERRTILCYRDSKGRKAFGRLRQGETSDRFYGHITSFQLDVVDFVEGPYFKNDQAA